VVGKMTIRELNKARAKLDNYSTSSTLETGLREVGNHPFSFFNQGRGPTSPSGGPFFHHPVGR